MPRIPTKQPARRRILLQRLEERVLFSATPGDPSFVEPEVGAGPLIDSHGEATIPLRAVDELIFVDSQVDDSDTLYRLVERQRQPWQRVFLLDADRDGVEQIAAEVSGRTGLNAIHIVSHGNDGVLHLGNSRLSGSSLNAYLEPLSQIRNSLSPNADVLLYGCNLAETQQGRDLVTQLGRLTNADVAASSDTTGWAAAGGDWDLEYSTGAVEASSINASSWRGTLAGPADEVWVLGANGTKIDFRSGSPVVSDTLATEIADGFAAWTDPGTGELVLFTNGRDIWNGQSERVLANGSNLNASRNNSQPVAVIPIPGQRDQFYVFTVTDFFGADLYYSTVDMSATQDGAVIDKRIFIDNTQEGIDVIPHANGVDYWLLSFNRSATHITIDARQFGAAGILQTVTSDTALTFNTGYLNSFLVHSQDNTQLLMGTMLEGDLATATFDPATGVVSNPTLRVTQQDVGFGGAFSPDGTKFYYTVGSGGMNGTPHQYDLDTDTITQLSSETGHGGPGLGPDGRVYFARPNRATLSVVNDPNQAGVASSFSFQGFDITAGGTFSGARSNSALFNTVAVQPSLANAPLISLDADSYYHGRTLYVSVSSTDALNLADSDAFVSDADSNEFQSFEIRVQGAVDGDSETITMGGRSFLLGTTTTQVSDLIGGTAFNIAFDASTGVFALTRSGGGDMAAADIQSLIRGVTYQHTDTVNRTYSQRTVQFVVSDGQYSSNAATAFLPIGFQVVNTDDNGTSQGSPRVAALDNGGFVAIWDSFQNDGSNGGVSAQLFGPSGQKVGANFIVNEHRDNNQRFSNVVGVNGGGFAVAFTSATDNDLDPSTDAATLRIFDQAGVPITGDLTINTYTFGQQFRPDVERLDDGSLVVVWQSFNQDGDGMGIYGQRVSAVGDRIGGEFKISSTALFDQDDAVVTSLSDGGFVVAWEDIRADIAPSGNFSRGVFAQRYDAAGQRVGDQFALGSYREGSQADLTLVRLSRGFIAAWRGFGPGSESISQTFFRRFDENGQPIGAEQLVGAGSFSSSLPYSITGLPDGGWYVVWEHPSVDGILGQRYNANGIPVGAESVLESDPGGSFENPDVTTLTSGNLALISINRSDVIVAREVPLGSPSLSIQDLATNSEPTNQVPYTDFDVPIYVDQGRNAGINDFGTTLLTELQVTLAEGDSTHDTISLENQGNGPGQISITGTSVSFEGTEIGTLDDSVSGQFTITFSSSPTQPAVETLIRSTTFASSALGATTSLREIRFDLNTATGTVASEAVVIAVSPRGSEFTVNTLAPGHQELPDVVRLADGNYLVAWQDNLAEVDETTIRGRIYSPSGIPKTEPFFIATLVRDNDQRNVAIAALDTGGFVATYQTTTARDADADGYAIAAQRFDASGHSVGNELQISQTEPGDQAVPSVTGLSGGRFAIAWEGQTATDVIGVATRIFDNSGNALTTELPVNVDTIGGQTGARITTLSTGDFVVVWQESDGSISFRRFDDTGVPLDANALTANTRTGQQSHPDVVAYDSGFAIAWQGDGPGDDAGIFLRRFDQFGNGLAAETLVNRETSGSQSLVGLTASDQLIGVVWSGEGSGDSDGVFFRAFGHAGPAVTDPVLVNSLTSGEQRAAAVVPGQSFDEWFAVWESVIAANNTDIQARLTNISSLGAIDLDANDSSGAADLDYVTSYMEGNAMVALSDSDVLVVPVNVALYDSLTLQVSGVVDSNQELLHFGGQTLDLSSSVLSPVSVVIQSESYDYTYDLGTGELVIAKNGGGTISQGELAAVIRDFHYEHSGVAPTESPRTFEWQADESGVSTSSSETTVNVRSLNASPVIGVDATVPYTQGAAPIIVDNSISISDADDTLLESAVVTISNVDIARDLLTLDANATSAALAAGISVAPYNVVNGQLRLTGSASLVDYQAVLQGVQFESLSPVAGNRTIEFVLNDGSSNSAPGIASILYTVDVTPPPTPTQPLDMLAVSDTGVSDTDNNTRIADPQFVIPAGTGVLGDTVAIYIDGAILGTAPILADGSAVYTPPAFTDGTFQLAYSLIDVVGNESGLAPAVVVTIDTQNSPGTLFVTNEDFNTSTPRIRGASQSAPGEYLELEVGGNTYSVTATGTFWGFEIPASDALSDGDYAVTVTRFDQAGNAQQASGNISIDTVAPVIPTVDVQTSATSTPTITGTATLGTGEFLSVEVDGIVYFNSGSQLNLAGNVWTLDIINDIDPDGTYEVIATATDQAGNVSVDTTVGELIVDTIEPSPPSVTPLNTNDTSPSITGTAFLEPGEFLEVTVNGTTYSQLSGDISFSGLDWTLVIPEANALPEGRYDVAAVSSDGAGNTTGDGTVDELGIDLTPPTIPTVDPLTTADPTPAITGNASLGMGETLQITVNGRSYSVGAGLSIIGTVWTLQIPNLFAFTASGVYDVLAAITDSAGNVSSDVTVGELTMDLVDAPTVNPLATNDPTPAITGTAALLSGETLTVQVDGVTYSVGDGNLSRAGSTWTLTVPTGSELSDGTYEVLARVTDIDGNSATDQTTNELIVDTVVPTVPTVDSLVTNDLTPQITGTVVLNAGELLSVTVGGFTYSMLDPELTVSSSTWTLQIPTGRELSLNGTYEVEASVTDVANNQSTDVTTGELVLDTLAPNPPAVDSLISNDSTPSITGTANLAADETLTVQVDGILYTLADGDLSLVGSAWTLVVPNGNSLADGTYEVIATASDIAGNATQDGTLNEVVIDTVAPPIPTVDALVSNSPVPFLTGNATLDAGDRLTVELAGQVYDDSQPHLTVTGGSWSLQVPAFGAIAADGVYEVIVIASDLAGNQSTDTTIGEFTKDTVLPDAPVVNPIATNQVTPAITGSANLAVDETLTVEVEGIVYTMGDGLLSVSGADWTLTIPPGNALTEGNYEVLATVTDSLGNQNVDSTTNELTVDLTAPIIPTVDSQTSNDPTPLLTGTAVLAVDESFSVRVNGVTYFDTGPELLVSGGNWSLQIPLLHEFTANGTYDIEAIASDPAGNVSSDTTVGEFVFDTLLPDAPIVDLLATNDTTPAITGTANLAVDELLSVEVNGVTYLLGDGDLSIAGSDWTLVIPPAETLAEGSYEVVAIVRDSLGNQNSDATTNELLVDTTPPAVPTVDLLSSNDSTPLLTGTAALEAAEEMTVRVNGVTYFEVDPHLTVTGSNWSLLIPVSNEFTADGTYDVEVVVSDAAGNVSTDVTVGEFVYDTSFPDAPTVDTLATNSTTPVVTGTANLLPGESLVVEIDGVAYGQGSDLSFAGSVWTLVVPAGNSLAEGTYEVTATATDAAGNSNVDSTSDELVIDLTPPAIPTVDVLVSNDPTPLLTGSATVLPGEEFRVRVNGNDYLETGPNLTLAGSNWALQIPSSFQFTSVGSYEIEAIVTDLAGNVSTDSSTLEFTFDNTLPDAPTVDTLGTNDSSPAITGTANLAGDETLSVEVDGVTYDLGDGALGITGSIWTLVVPAGNSLAEGNYDVLATVTDSLGNANSDATTGELTVDLTPPLVPTANLLTTNDPTPLLTGTAIVGTGESLSIVANGITFVPSDPHLTLAGPNWSLLIPAGNQFTVDGAYDIRASIADLAGNISFDATLNEFVYDTLPPNAPTVDSLVTNDTTPTLTGSANLGGGETLTVELDGTTYVPGDGHLTRTGADWNLVVPNNNAIAEGTYEVVALATDAAGNATGDGTTNELTVDTTPPVVPTVDVLVSNDPTPLITGTATIGTDESLTVSVNGNTYLELGAELTRAGSNWSLQIPMANQFTFDGAYDVVAVVTDLAGNQSSDPTSGEFTLDTASPNAPSADSLITNDTTPTLTGMMNLAADESLSVEVDGSVYSPGDGNLTVSGTTWELVIPASNALAEGAYDVTARVVDSLGNAANDPTNGELQVDLTAPITPTVTPLASNDSTPILQGTASLAPGETLRVLLNGQSYLAGDGNLSLNGTNWSLQVPVGNEFTVDGLFNVEAIVTDEAGNVSIDLTTNEFLYDTTLPDAPTVDLLTTNDPTPSITGNANLAGDESLTVTVNGRTYREADPELTLAGSAWVLMIASADALPEGTYDVDAVVTDALGNANNDTTSNELVIDLTPPAVPTSDALVSNNATPILTGSAQVAVDETLTVTVNGRTYSVGDGNLVFSGNSWSLQIPAGNAFTSDGTYDVEVTVTDSAGNRSTDPTSGEFVYDTIPPSPPTVNFLTTNDSTPMLTGTATLAAGETLQIDLNGQTYGLGGGQLSLAGSDWTLAVPLGATLPEGVYEVTARAVDAAGNTAMDTTTDELTIDLTPPIPPTVNLLTDNLATPTLTGTANLGPGESLQVQFHGQSYSEGDGNLSLSGNIWTLQVPPSHGVVGDGAYDVTAIVSDSAGNSSADATSGEYVLDTALPEVPTVNPLLTNSSTPVITGTANLAADESLSVEVDGLTYVPGDGSLNLTGSTWALTIPIADSLAEGTYDVTATSVDALGNFATDLTTDEVVIDRTPPAVPTVNSLIDNDATPLLTGTAQLGAGETLTVEANGTTYTVGDGHLELVGNNWSLQVPAIGAYALDGTYDIRATAGDAAGNLVNDNTSGEFTLDTVLPALPTVHPLITNDPTPTLTGTAVLSADETLAVTVNGSTYLLGAGDLTMVGADWTLRVPSADSLTEGVYEVRATVTDSLGNTVDDASNDELIIDQTPPASPTTDTLVTNDATPVISGTVNLAPGEFLSVQVNGQTYLQNDGNLSVSGNRWSLQIPLGSEFTVDGTYDVTATASDSAGNTNNDSTSGELVFDTTPPAQPTVDGLLTNDTTPVITGTATLGGADRLTVTVDGQSYTESSSALTTNGITWALAIPSGNSLAEGSYDVVATAADALGNSISDATNNELEIDITPPAVPTVNAITSNDRTPLLSGEATFDPGHMLTVRFQGTTFDGSGGHLTFVGNSWFLQVPSANEVTNDGTYEVTAEMQDLAGNTATDVTAGEYTLDSSLPNAAVVHLQATNDTTPVITGTVALAPGDSLTVSVDGQTYVPGDGNLSVTGNDWSLTIPASLPLPEGVYDVVALTTNSLGSTNTDATVGELNIDLTPPTAPTVDLLTDNEPAPRITGTTVIEPGGTLSVEANGRTYFESDANLTRTGNAWALQVPLTHAYIADGTYSIVATARDAAGNSAVDVTDGEYILDTVPPAVPTVDQLTTNDVTPRITGTANMAFDEQLSVVVNGVTYDQPGGNLSVSGATWELSVALGNALADGTFDVTATVIDSLGNFSSDTTVDELTIDLTPPPMPTVESLVDNDPTPLLSGTAVLVTGDTLSVTFAGTTYQLGDGNLSHAGSRWSLQVPAGDALSVDGTYDVVAVAADEFGNQATDITVDEYVLDTVLPASPVVDFVETNDTTPVIFGSAQMLADESLSVRVNGITYLQGDGQLNVFGAGIAKTWDLQIPVTDAIPEGIYDVDAFTTDALGNVAEDVSAGELTIDLTPPAFVPTVDSLLDNEPAPLLTGTALLEPGESLAVVVNGRSYSPGDGHLTHSGSAWTLQVALTDGFTADGTYDIVAAITDAAGNQTVDVTLGEYTLDTVLPAAPVIHPLSTNDRTPTITGTAVLLADESLSLSLNGVSYAVGDGNLSLVGSDWALAVPNANLLSEGVFEVTATVIDSLGNANQDATTDELNIDLTAPVVPTVSPSSSNSSTPLLSGTAVLGAGEFLSVTVQGVTYLEGDGHLSMIGSTWLLQVPSTNAFPGDGTYDIEATVIDAAGNASTDVTSGEFTLDSTLPDNATVQILETNNVTPTISGTVSLGADETLTVQVDGVTYVPGDGDLTLSGSQWFLTIPPVNALAEGVYDVQAVVTDSLGNSSRDATVGELIIDLTSPAIPTVNPLITNVTNPGLSGTAVLLPGETLSVELSGHTYVAGDGNLAVAGDGDWTLQVPVANSLTNDGRYDIAVTVSDVAGNVSMDNSIDELELDRQPPPRPTVDTLVTNNQTPTITGTASLSSGDTLQVTLDGQAYAVGDGQLSLSNGVWRLVVPATDLLAEGTYEVTATSADDLGNANDDLQANELTIDLTPPATPTVDALLTNDSTPVLTGTAPLGPGEALTVTVDGVIYGVGDGNLTVAGPMWTLEIPTVNAFTTGGPQEIVATITDAAGNATSDGTTNEIQLSIDPPSRPTVDSLDTTDSTPVITGDVTLAPADRFSVEVDGVVYSPGDGQLVLAGGRWTLQIPGNAELPFGVYDVVASVTDIFDNVAIDATVSELTVNPAAATPPFAFDSLNDFSQANLGSDPRIIRLGTLSDRNQSSLVQARLISRFDQREFRSIETDATAAIRLGISNTLYGADQYTEGLSNRRGDTLDDLLVSRSWRIDVPLFDIDGPTRVQRWFQPSIRTQSYFFQRSTIDHVLDQSSLERLHSLNTMPQQLGVREASRSL